jgi:hypothetical protein
MRTRHGMPAEAGMTESVLSLMKIGFVDSRVGDVESFIKKHRHACGGRHPIFPSSHAR